MRTPKTILGKTISNQRGIMTLDFIFALLLGMSFTLVFFALTLTLSLVEVTQYISFSVARSALGAHETRSMQTQLGDRKYAELRSRPVFRAIFGRGWFRLPAQPDYGDPVHGFNLEYAPKPEEDNATFYGARIKIEARILDINIPMLGSSKTKPETGIANVQTFLGREVTTTECRDLFNRQRWTGIQQLSGADYASIAVDPQSIALITDNGC